jgi:two-component system, chemotaxis family, sensor kinase CheA
MDALLREFLTETNESLDVVDVELVRFEQDPNNVRILDNIFRLVHTIKGTCGFLGLPRLAALAHAAETLMGKFRESLPVTSEAVNLILATIDRIKEILEALENNQREPDGADNDLIAALACLTEPKSLGSQQEARTGPRGNKARQRSQPRKGSLNDLDSVLSGKPGSMPAEAPGPAAEKDHEKIDEKPANPSIRVSVATLETLMTMVSELVLTRNQLLEMARRKDDSEFKVPLQRLSNVTAELQESVMKTRMQPIGNAWQKLPRIVRDLADELGKQIELEMQGAETELDRQVLDRIKDPLTHMIRNSADHGIETPQERLALGKPARGTIRLTAYHEGGYVIIAVADDGRGLDTARIKAMAGAAGLVPPASIEKMTEAQIHRLIFTPGFSTASEITSISGRGVGMDVVQTNIDQIGGSVDVKSVPGEGLVFTLKIPLTLAIISALIIEAGGERFAIPQLAVTELVRIKANSEHRIDRIKQAPVLRLRNKLLPLTFLSKLLRLGVQPDHDVESGYIVVVDVGNQIFGLMVEGVFHTEEIVVKPLATKLRHITLFSGNTILGDGSVIMIIDPNGIAESLGSSADSAIAAAQKSEAPQSAEDETGKTSVLVFRAGSPGLKAVPLTLVTRLEEVDVRKIEMSNGRHLLQYRGQLMPLIAVNDQVRIKDEGAQPLLVFSDGGRSMALVVDEIVDIVENQLDIEVASDRAGILGSAVIKGEASEVIDVAHFLPLAFADWFRGKNSHSETRSRRLLFVEDSAFFRNMLTPVLTAAGYQVTAVAGGEEALALVNNGMHVDIVVTDLAMPGMDGVALAEALRRNSGTAATPIIALSSMTSAHDIARVRQAGIHDFIAKFDRQGLIAALKEQTDDIDRAA